MSFQLIPFNNNTLPSYLKASQRRSSDLMAGVSSGFARLSIEGKTWTIVRGKNDKVKIRNPKDPDELASSVSLIIVRASANLSRVYYSRSYEKGVDLKPDCLSNDGIHPDPVSAFPQAKTCAACQHAVYGTGEGGRGFKCANFRRLAVASSDNLEEPMLLNVPGASLKNLSIYGAMLDARGVPYDAVVTKIKFDPDTATPKLVFEPVGFVPESMFASIQQIAESDTVAQILGIAIEDKPKVPVTTSEVAEVMAEVEKPKRTAAPKQEPAPVEKPAPVVEEPAPVVEEPAPAPVKAKKAGSFDDAFEAMLTEFDD